MVGLLPEESRDFVSCVIDGSDVGTCAKTEVIKQLPPETRDYANCLMFPTPPETCTAREVARQLPPDARALAECLAKAKAPETCGKPYVEKAAQKAAMDAYNKIEGGPNASGNDVHGPIRNIIDVADGIGRDDWWQVLQAGGAGVTKIAGHAVLLATLGPVGANVFGGALDAAVDNRSHMISELMKAAKARDPAWAAKAIFEAQIGYSTDVACAVIDGDAPVGGPIKEAVCGELHKLISLGGDAVKWGTGVLADLLHFKDVMDLFATVLDDARHLAAQKSSDCDKPDKYYGEHFLRCYSKDAYLRQSGGDLAQNLSGSLYGDCRKYYQRCLFSGDGRTDEITKVCAPMRARFDADTGTLAAALPEVVSKFVTSQRSRKDACNWHDLDFERLETDCEAAIERILPPTGDVDTPDCQPPPQPIFGGPADTLYEAVCKQAVARERKSLLDFCVAGLKPLVCFGDMKLDANGNCTCPPGTFWDAPHCRRTVTLTPTTIGRPVPVPALSHATTIGCQPPRPVGTPPNCCPEGTYFSNGVCHYAATARDVKVPVTIPNLTRTPQVPVIPNLRVPVTIPQVTRTQQYVSPCPRGAYSRPSARRSPAPPWSPGIS